MGNPAIHPVHEPADDLPAPEVVRMIWHVYLLRDRDGRPMTRGAIIGSKRTGVLTLDTVSWPKSRAMLEDVSGYPPLLNLWDVRRVRITGTGLLMQGQRTVGSKNGPIDVPAAWWCVPAAQSAA
jgi:hypothetical protein